jgi:cytochrome c biogenesis factor
MTLIGELSLWVALLMTAWSTTVSFAGAAGRRDDLIESGIRGLYATFAMVLLAAIGLWSALLSRDYSLQYVAEHVNASTPTLYLVSAFWSGPSGSTLLWALILSMVGSIAIATARAKNSDLVSWATGTVSAILVFFVGMTAIQSNPYARLAFTPMDGRGMNAQLQSFGMAIHSPMLYLGAVAAAIPFAFAIAALCAGRLDGHWLVAVRAWSLVSWLFVTAGIMLIMWSSYAGIGLSAYWTWTPAENLCLLLWLAITTSLHLIGAEERRRTLRKWNVLLIVASFLLAIAGMFTVRDGAFDRTHSLAQLATEPWFATFFFAAAGTTIFLVGSRLRDVDFSATLGSLTGREAFVGRNRRYGAHIAHGGIVILFVGFAAMAFRGDHRVTLRSGDAFDVADPYGRHWRFVSQGLSTASHADRAAIMLSLEAFVDGKRVGFMSSERQQYVDAQGNGLSEAFTSVGIHSTPILDTYVAVDDTQGTDVAQLRVTFNPLAMWVWVGGVVMLLGGLVVTWPTESGRS